MGRCRELSFGRISGTIQAKVNFDTAVSEARYYVVSSLFDQVITFRHKELQAATKAIQDADPKVRLAAGGSTTSS